MQCRANTVFHTLIVFTTDLSLKFQYNFTTPHAIWGLVSREWFDSIEFSVFFKLNRTVRFVRDFFEIR